MHFSMEIHCSTADITIEYQEKCIRVKPLIYIFIYVIIYFNCIVYTAYNQIKFIDVNAFKHLNNLERLDLYNNKCINIDFKIPTEYKQEVMLKEIEDNCGQK